MRERGIRIVVPSDAAAGAGVSCAEGGRRFQYAGGCRAWAPGGLRTRVPGLEPSQLDRSRLENYLAAFVPWTSGSEPQLEQAAPLLARSLAIKVDEKCLG